MSPILVAVLSCHSFGITWEHHSDLIRRKKGKIKKKNKRKRISLKANLKKKKKELRLIRKLESREWWAESQRAARQDEEERKKAMRALEDVFKDGREQGKGSKRYP